MIKNYFKIAWRNLMKHKAYTTINITGLAVGIAACLLIFVVIQHETSYDKFQPEYKRIYRVITNTRYNDGGVDYNSGIAVPAVNALKTDFPQLEKVAAISIISNSQVTVLGDNPNSDAAIAKKFIEGNNGIDALIFAQPEYFDIVTAKWLAGGPQTLADPSAIVLNQKLATKYFGSWQSAVGKYLKIDNEILAKVTGVVEDMPANTDFTASGFLSYEAFKKSGDKYYYSDNWGSTSSSHQIYTLLPASVPVATINTHLKAFVKKHYTDAGNSKRELLMQPLKDIHFDARYPGMGTHSVSRTILWTLGLIGMLIIVMASINFVNLSTAQAVGRSREVGIRKVMGSSRTQLVRQVMGETFLTVLLSSLLAIIIAAVSLPYLSHVASVPDNIPLFSVGNILFLVTVIILVTLLAGSYPAMVVSGFKPVLALKSKINSANIGGISLRRVLVITQFAISQMLIIGTIIAVSQMNFVRNADLGFNKEAVLVLPAYSDSANRMHHDPLKQQLLQNPGVLSVSYASDEVSSGNKSSFNFAFDHREDENFALFSKFGDNDYLKTYGLQLVAGRNYERSDTAREVLVNEKLLAKLGIKDPKEILGKELRMGRSQWFPIVGVVKDFKSNSLREETDPVVIAPLQRTYSTVSVKMRTANLSQTMADIKQKWEKAFPEYAYTSHFTDETIDQFYRQESQLSLLYKLFAGIAIFISCLGLYGLVSFMAVQKNKEVGIRKVLGASVGSIVVMFSKEFTLLIGLAFVIAVPLAWYFMNNWLSNFAYRINIGIGVFAAAVILSLVIAWITVGYRAVKAALTNPIKSLRTE